MYDGDSAGKHAAENLYKYISDIFYTEIIELPEDIDPGKLNEIEVKHIVEEYYA